MAKRANIPKQTVDVYWMLARKNDPTSVVQLAVPTVVIATKRGAIPQGGLLLDMDMAREVYEELAKILNEHS